MPEIIPRIEMLPEANYRVNYGRWYELWIEMLKDSPTKAKAELAGAGLNDLFVLLYFILGIEPVNHPWLIDRINEVESCNDGTVDLWAREHWKSTIITYGLTIQEILRNPEERVGIFSHTRGIAKAFLRRIKATLETSDLLKDTYTSILFAQPQKDSPKWSEDEGIVVRRNGTYLESTVEAWGLVDGMPTSRHYTIRVYDDVVTRESVTTPDQIAKVKEAFELSHNLGSEGGKVRVIGTRYHFADLYSDLIKQDIWNIRTYPALEATKGEDGTISYGVPVLLSQESINKKRINQGPYVFSCQQLLNPVAEDMQEFKPSWVNYWQRLPEPINKFLLVDPANSKKRSSDYTVMVVIGIDTFHNYYLIDMLRKRLNLHERWKALRDMVLDHSSLLKVGYERYGMQSDVEYFQREQRREGINFAIQELGGKLKKEERIRRLIPLFAANKFYIPYSLHQDNEEIIKIFLEEEYNLFPFSPHDDMLDAMARVLDADLYATAPVQIPVNKDPYAPPKRSGSWMSV